MADAPSLLSASPEGLSLRCGEGRGTGEASAPLSYSDQRALLSQAVKEEGPALASCASSHGNSSSKNMETRLLFGPVSRAQARQGAAARSGPSSVSVSRISTCNSGSVLPTDQLKRDLRNCVQHRWSPKALNSRNCRSAKDPGPCEVGGKTD